MMSKVLMLDVVNLSGNAQGIKCFCVYLFSNEYQVIYITYMYMRMKYTHIYIYMYDRG